MQKKCYEDILKNDFISREIYNNLGLVFLLKELNCLTIQFQNTHTRFQQN